MHKILAAVFSIFLISESTFAQTNWTKYPVPVLPRTMNYPDWNALASADACVLLVNDTFKIWYSGAGWLLPDTVTHVSIGYAWSLNGINWNQYPGNPVLQHSSNPADPDYYGTETANVIYDSAAAANEKYKMWYSGKQDESDLTKSYKVCYAYSPDGINWTKYSGNPVLAAGDSSEWNNVMITNVSVLKDNGVYKIWFASPDVYPNSQTTDFKGNIGYAYSNDGINWIKHPTPVLQAGIGGSPDSASVAEPSVLKIGNTYHMWYSMINSWSIENFAVGYASSTDGINWTKATNNPVLPLGNPGSWDAYWSAHPGVVYDAQNQQLMMFYTGLDSTDFSSITSYTWEIGLATCPFITGISEEEISPVQIFPQPAGDEIFIRSAEMINAFTIYELSGKIIHRETVAASANIQISLQEIPAGMYIAEFVAANGIHYRKQIIRL